jgi:cytochrome c peroxidase
MKISSSAARATAVITIANFRTTSVGSNFPFIQVNHLMNNGQSPFRGLAIIAIAVLASSSGLSARAAGSPNLVAIGKKIFFDPSLSASGKLSCATCHDPNHAYGPPNGLAAQLGGSAMDRQGPRAVPSLRYVLNRTPVWNKQFVSNPAERILEGEEPPTGGFGWDGRFNTLHDQHTFPLLSPNEMANKSPAEVVAKLRRAPYAKEIEQAFGPTIFDDPQKAMTTILTAVERFELEDRSFHPFTSRYDDYLGGKISLTAQERHGLELFDDPKRGNCSTCHLDQKGADGSHPIFTDYQFEALGVPRNPEIQANASKDYFDLGLCGPLRTDQAKETKYCGLFKTPTLRNVAARGVFFHNGRFHTLKKALQFYVQRDTDPKSWYPVSTSAQIEKFDDLPPQLRRNVDAIDEPLTRKLADQPAWTDAEINDVIAFLQTLTDRGVKIVDPSRSDLPVQ